MLALVTLCLNTSITANSETLLSQYVQTQLTARNGLPQNSVAAVTQTRDGYLWFGTEEGFARFDGIHFTTFSILNSKGLKDNFVQTLAADADGSLWIGTRSELTRYQNGQFQSMIAADNPIYTVFAAKDGKIWVGSQDHLYSVDHGRTHIYTIRDGCNFNEIHDIAQASDGSLWLATAQGLVQLNNGRFKLFTQHDNLPDNTILRVAPASDGSLWLATRGGLAHWNGNLLEDFPADRLPQRARISSLILDRKGALWIGYEHNGIARVTVPPTGPASIMCYSRRDGLPSDDVSKVFEDAAGDIWVGLQEGGAVEMREGLFESFGQKEGLSEDVVWSVLQASDASLWVGTNSSGLNHVLPNGKVRVFSGQDGLPQGAVNGLLEARDGSVWVGLEHGFLSHVVHDRITSYRDPISKDARIASILEDPKGDLWLAFHETDGLVRFSNGHFEHYKTPGLLNVATFAPDGSIWLGSDHGGVTHVVNGRDVSFTTADGLLSNFAQAVYVDKDGVAWAGTSPGGLNRIKNGKITTYSIAQGLYDLTVGAIVEDDQGNLWMTCNKGIFRVRKSELNDFADGKISHIHSVVYGSADGLRSAECNFGATPAVWKGRNGRLFFATMGGVATIEPTLSQMIPSPPAVTVESALINHQAVSFDRGISAGPGSTDLELQFTAPDFVSPDEIGFRYRLLGFDGSWVSAGQRRQAFYTRLPPGSYRLEVQASHGTGEWGPMSQPLSIYIKPYFWQTAWFRFAFGLALVLAILASHHLRTRFLVRRNLELERHVNERTKQLQAAIRAAELAQLALKEQASKDGLTGLWNRRSIFEILDREMDRSRREQIPVCVVMADIDHFKLINDSYGHQAGDLVLESVSRCISDLRRPYDSIGRYGGEEFLMVMPGCSLESAFGRSEELRRRVEALTMRLGSTTISVTCSFGVAVGYNPATAEELVGYADSALYAAKREGRNRVRMEALS